MATLPANIRIALRGNGSTIVKGAIENDVWENLLVTAKKFNASLGQAIFDCEFFDALNDAEIKSWTNFNNIFHTKGLMNDSTSFIEIKSAKKTLLKVHFKDIPDDSLLFPLYNTETVELNKKTDEKLRSITVVETEIGMIASYKIAGDDFRIDDLKFTIHKVQAGTKQYTLLNKLTYRNEILSSLNSDTLVTGCFSLIES